MKTLQLLTTLSIIWLFMSCATQRSQMQNIRTLNYPQSQITDTITLGYYDQVLELTNNKHALKWGKRKGIQLVAVRIVNNSSEPLRGFQLQFMDGNTPLKLVDNEWVGKRMFERESALPVIGKVFAYISFVWFFNSIFEDSDCTPEIDQSSKHRNSYITHELKTFELNEKILFPGRPIHGVIAVKSERKIENLNIRIKESDVQNIWF